MKQHAEILAKIDNNEKLLPEERRIVRERNQRLRKIAQDVKLASSAISRKRRREMASESSALSPGRRRADSHEAPQRLSEIRIVLLGERWSGKSSAGNTILGREEFETEGEPQECEKRQGEVAGRQITVVDTPGWGSSFIIRANPQRVREEVVRSVSLCPPGPHALLLVINVNSCKYWRLAEEHLELLSERVWRHTIVLFTWGDTLGDTTIEQHIERGGKKLQCLVEKCGNRYHVLNDRGDRTQVTELLEKIEDMVAENYGQYFTTDIEQLYTELETYNREIEELRQREEVRQRETEELRQREEERQRETGELRQRLEERQRETEDLRQREEERQRETEELRQRLEERQRETEDLRQREEERQRETEELRQREEERQRETEELRQKYERREREREEELRQRLEEEWSRREEELKEKMRKTLEEEELEKETEEPRLPVKRRNSRDINPLNSECD
ncbi:GTPase IMAP family member 9-like [Lepisosteus oculatus]|uniref:GTPase IMAP family member 9-like n=1 Tax=Lepisosteus oculatus TaxID=7918 RepID=UPI0035F52E66